MANIPSSLNKFNDQEISDNAPVSESLMYKMGGAVNYLVDFFTNTPVGFATFTASGTWVAPSNVKLVIAVGIGGGGGGGGGYVGDANNAGRGGGGGGSGVSGVIPCAVVPGQSYTVTIGAGGSGGAASAAGANGTATTFGSLATFGFGYAGNTQRLTNGGAGGSIGSPSALQPAGDGAQLGGPGGGGWKAAPMPIFGGNATASPVNSGAGGTGGSYGNVAYTGGAGGSGMLYLFWFTQA